MGEHTLTLQEAADELGVHYMTAYRYVRLGLIEATKRGGTWHVEPVALAEFRAGSPTAPVKAGERAPWSGRLEARLVAGDARGAWGVVESAMAAGAGVDEVYLDVLSPALVSIGERWERNELDVSVEHRASAVVQRIIGRIGPRFGRRGRTRGTLVVAGSVGEGHALPVSMIGDLLRLEGWDVADLGVDLPTASLVRFLVDSPDIDALGLSVTSDVVLDGLVQSCRSVRAELPELLIVAGGRAIIDDDHARSLGADHHASTSAEMTALVDADRARRGVASAFT